VAPDVAEVEAIELPEDVPALAPPDEVPPGEDVLARDVTPLLPEPAKEVLPVELDGLRNDAAPPEDVSPAPRGAHTPAWQVLEATQSASCSQRAPGRHAAAAAATRQTVNSTPGLERCRTSATVPSGVPGFNW